VTSPKRFVYVIRSCSDPNRSYTGVTSNVRKRLASGTTVGERPATAASVSVPRRRPLGRPSPNFPSGRASFRLNGVRRGA
jgi:hypothetical protein